MEVGLEGVRNAVFVRFQIINHGSYELLYASLNLIRYAPDWVKLFPLRSQHVNSPCWIENAPFGLRMLLSPPTTWINRSESIGYRLLTWTMRLLMLEHVTCGNVTRSINSKGVVVVVAPSINAASMHLEFQNDMNEFDGVRTWMISKNGSPT